LWAVYTHISTLSSRFQTTLLLLLASQLFMGSVLLNISLPYLSIHSLLTQILNHSSHILSDITLPFNLGLHTLLTAIGVYPIILSTVLSLSILTICPKYLILYAYIYIYIYNSKSQMVMKYNHQTEFGFMKDFNFNCKQF